MGYTPPKSQLNKLRTANTQTERVNAVADILEGYNRYRSGMRTGLFGLIFGRWMFPAKGDMPIIRIDASDQSIKNNMP